MSGILACVLGRGLVASPAAQAIDGLAASGPFHEYAQKLMLFGQFVGDWEFDVVHYRPDGSQQAARGEWHFGWILEGRAVQDVWMVPSRAEREKTRAGPTGYGTTVRFYDPEIDAWHVTWSGVVTGSVFVFVARQQGDEIVMEGQEANGLSRWIFSEITPRSFHWRAVVSRDSGRTWEKEQEMFVRRRQETK